MAAVVDHRLHLFSRLFPSATFNTTYLLGSILTISILLPICRFIHRDYHAFLSLGPGVTPSTFAGYLRVSCLRFFALKDPLNPPSVTSTTLPSHGYLRHLPLRAPPRPTTAGIAPQRQVDQKPSAEVHQILRNHLHSLVAAYPSLLHEGKSCFEKHGLALFMSPCSSDKSSPARRTGASHALFEVDSAPRPIHVNQTCGDTSEICHLHASDSSMHLTLHPDDAALVIGQGWGERHPLAGRLILGKRLLPSGFVMVYAPRRETDVKVLMEIVKAASWWVGGVALQRDEEHEAPRAFLKARPEK